MSACGYYLLLLELKVSERKQLLNKENIMIKSTSTAILEKKNDDDVVEGYIKQLLWETEYYTLVIQYPSEDGVNFLEENPYVGIRNNNSFKIELVPDFDSNFNYSGVSVSMYSNLAETAEELAELSENLKSVSNSVELFNKVISERL